MAARVDRIAIDSWKQLQERLPSVLERLNADPALALAAAVNPLYALEEFGLQINPHVRPEIEDRLRFRPSTTARLTELRDKIYRQVGRPFDLDSGEELERVLFEKLDLILPAAVFAPPESAGSTTSSAPAGEKPADPSGARYSPGSTPHPLRPLVHEPGHAGAPPDPLESLRGAHPVIEPLLEYRRLESSQPRLAPRALYDQVRHGKRRLGIERVRIRLKGQR